MNTKKKQNYRALERKMFLRIVWVMAAALIGVFLLQSLARGYFGEFVAELIRITLRTSRSRALDLYHRVFRSNLEYILMGAVAISFLVLSRALLSQFSKYFNEICDKLDILVEDRDADITLPPEMAAMENKIKTIKRTLDTREQDAKQAEQRKNDLVMYLAHDIKTPLTSVVGYLSLLDEAQDMPPEQTAKYVRVALDKSHRLEQLIDEFFEITRYNLQSIPLSSAQIDLSYMLAQMADEFYPQLSADGKRAAVHAPEQITLYGDADKLARVFRNILKNAVAYSPKDSVIDITATQSGDRVSVVFANDGGIPQDKLASIFDKFYRLDAARSPDRGGAGLGLAIAKELVAAHGGHISAESDGLRTSFTVELPQPSAQ